MTPLNISEKIKKNFYLSAMLEKGDKVRFTSPYYSDIWVDGVIGENVHLDRQMNSGHGMWWDPMDWFFDNDGRLRNIEKL